MGQRRDREIRYDKIREKKWTWSFESIVFSFNIFFCIVGATIFPNDFLNCIRSLI